MEKLYGKESSQRSGIHRDKNVCHGTDMTGTYKPVRYGD